MSTDVEGTTVAVEDRTEADWAMMYAEENKRRVKAERRLKGMSAAAATLIGATHHAIDAVMKPANTDQAFMDDVIKRLAKVVLEAFDAELMVNLGTFDPPWGIEDKYKEALRADRGSDQNLTPTEERLRDEYFELHTKNMAESWQACLAEWKLICQEEGFNPVEEVKAEVKRKFAAKVMIKSIADKSLMESMEKQSDENASH